MIFITLNKLNIKSILGKDIKSIFVISNYIKTDNSPFKQTFKVRYEFLSLINIKFNTELFEHFLNGI